MRATMTTPVPQLDHLVVTAPSLAVGRAWAEARLGVALQDGGRHQQMGTHNALLRLGPACYLEVIAIEQSATPPDRPRWFELDRLGPDDAPRLATWVARVAEPAVAVAACPVPLGEYLPMRRGDLSWRLTVPPDGRLVGGGLVPALITWDDMAKHPGGRLEDRGCSLAEVSGVAPATQAAVITSALDRPGLRDVLDVRPADGGALPRLVARISTPSGIRVLD